MYVVIKETGEYSNFDYVPLAVFKEIDNAYTYQSLKEYEADILNKIAHLRRERWDAPTFEVVELPEIAFDSDHSLETEMAKLDEMYKDKLQSAVKWREEYDRKEADNEAQRIRVETERQRMNVYVFIDWWNAGGNGDPFFEDKKTARLREVKKDLQGYLLRSADDKVLSWMRENHISLSF
jgi:hypothetical protein